MSALTTSPIQREFEKYAARTKRRAYNLAYRWTGNRDDAEDLMQDAYYKAYRSFDKYDRAMPFENWFFRILTNLAIDRARRKHPVISRSLDQQYAMGDDGAILVPDIPDNKYNPEVVLMSKLVNKRVQNALQRMGCAFRTAILMCDVHGMSYADIAETTGVTLGTVRSRIHRGRNMLRDLYNGDVSKKPRRIARKTTR